MPCRNAVLMNLSNSGLTRRQGGLIALVLVACRTSTEDSSCAEGCCPSCSWWFPAPAPCTSGRCRATRGAPEQAILLSCCGEGCMSPQSSYLPETLVNISEHRALLVGGSGQTAERLPQPQPGCCASSLSSAAAPGTATAEAACL